MLTLMYLLAFLRNRSYTRWNRVNVVQFQTLAYC